jgi:hypothetical protein
MQMACAGPEFYPRRTAAVQHVSAARQSDNVLFESGPPLGLQRHLGLVKGTQFNVVQRALLVILIGWVPLVILSIMQALVLHTSSTIALLWDAGAHARFLLAAPLLVLAEVECGGRLSAVVRHFADDGLVGDADRKHFDSAVASTRRLLDSAAVEIIVVALAYIIAVTTLLSLPIDQIPAWHKSSGVVPVYSLAGWWHILVSLPLLLILILAWMWRLALWTRLLWRIARLNLRLVASHPDHAAGLGFVGISVRGFSTVTAAFAIISAGRSANIVLLGGALPTQYFVVNVGMLLTVVVLFVAPLFVFTPKLANVMRDGTFRYGTLAYRVGSAFEDKWLGRNEGNEQTALDKPDFSATTDLYSITANVYALRLVPIDVLSLMVLGGAMLVPFIPVVLLAVPMDVIWSSVKGLLF